MNFSRKTILVVGAALLAACGDKVTVQEYTPPAATPATPKVNSVSVAPANATLTVGQTVTMTAAVNADAGLATTVTWSSSDATKASVSAAGVVTAVAVTPGVAICATSTVDTGKKGCASIVVQAAASPAATTPASISIGYVKNKEGYAVNKDSVTGTIQVGLNVLPGGQTVSKVVLLVGAVRIDSQTFTAAQSAALRYAADEAVAAQTAFPEIVFNVNTKSYNAETGVPTYTNGAKAVSAQLYTTASTTAATATAAQNLTFTNADFVDGKWTLPSTAKTAQDAAGYTWTSMGAASATASLKVVSVNYSGKTVSKITTTMPSASVGNNDNIFCTTSQAAKSVCTVLPTGADTATIKVATLSGNTGTVAYGLFNLEAALGDITTGVIPKASVVYTDGSSIELQALPTATGLRFDNKGPTRGTFTMIAPAYKDANGTAPTSTRYYQSKAKANLKPSVLASNSDSASIIDFKDAVWNTLENGVSRSIGTPGTDKPGSTTYRANPNGLTYKVFANAGGTAAGADTTYSTWTDITGKTFSEASLKETGTYCMKVTSYDALGNASLEYNDGYVATAGGAPTTGYCASNSTYLGLGVNGKVNVDDTKPVLTWDATGVNFSSIDTALVSVSTSGVNYHWTVSEDSNSVHSFKITRYVNSTGSRVTNYWAAGSFSTTSSSPTATKNTSMTPNFFELNDGSAFSATTLTGGQYIISINATDKAGNVATALTRIIVADNTTPTVTAPPTNAISLGSSVTLSTNASDDLSVQNAAAYYSLATAMNGITAVIPADTTLIEAFTTTGYAKFLGTAVTQTVTANNAPAYVNSYFDVGTIYAAASSFYPSWGMYVADQAKNTASSTGAVAMNYFWDVLDADAATYYPGIIGGLTANASASAAFTGSSTTYTTLAANTTAQAANAGSQLSSTFTQKITTYRYYDRDQIVWNGKTYLANNTAKYCYPNRGGTASPGYGIINTSSSGSSTTAATQWVASTNQPTAIPAPANVGVYMIAKVGGGTALVKYGDATLVAAEESALSGVKYCDQTITRTYRITVTPGARTTWAWHNNNAVFFLYTFGRGQAVWGSPIWFTYKAQ